MKHPTQSAARQTAACPEPIRVYCRQGLLDPERDSAGRRLFTDSDIQRVREIYLGNMALFLGVCCRSDRGWRRFDASHPSDCSHGRS
jgi:hypothetical protein